MTRRPTSLRKPLAGLVSALTGAIFSIHASAAPGPLRVLFLGKAGTPSADHAHVLMRELGRDAIWFEYTADPAVATGDWMKRFDAVLLDAPQASFPALATLPSSKP